MRIENREVVWGGLRFKRDSILGFEHEGDYFYAYSGSREQKIKLGHCAQAWPFSTSAAPGQTHLVHLVQANYRFLPEHILAIQNDKSQPTITVWTALGEFVVQREQPSGYAEMQKKPGFSDSLADEWIAAFELHKADPFCI